MNTGIFASPLLIPACRRHGIASRWCGVAAPRRCLARSRHGFVPGKKFIIPARGEQLATEFTRPEASSRGPDEGWTLAGQRFVAQCATTHSTAEDMVQSANQILHQLEAAGAATNAAQQSGSNGGIVSGYSSSTGSMYTPLSSPTSSGDFMPLDEYSSSHLDFSDLAYEDAGSDASKGEGVAGAYGKANYEVLRLDSTSRARRFFVRRRDLLREHRLQPRDLRRIDPSLDFTKTSPSITIKEDVLLLNLGGVRAIVTAEKALLFEPISATSRKFLEVVLPRLQSHGAERQAALSRGGDPASAVSVSHADYMARFYHQGKFDSSSRTPPFELEVLEGALTVAVGRLDAEMAGVTGRVSALLTKLPGDITPVNLEELRRVKQALVELEDKADTLREMLEELMDDEDELRELNLSSRPRREDRRRQRERNRLEREVERAREIKEELEERALEDEEGQQQEQEQQGMRLQGRGGGGAAEGLQEQEQQQPRLGDGFGVGVGGGGGGIAGGHLGPLLHAANVGMSLGASLAARSGLAGGNNSNPGGGAMQHLPQQQQPGSSMPHPASAASNGVYSAGNGNGVYPAAQTVPPPSSPYGSTSYDGGSLAAATRLPAASPAQSRQERLKELRTKYDRDRLRELRARFGWVREGREEGRGGAGGVAPGGGAGGGGLALDGGRKEERDRDRDRRKELIEEADFMSRLGDSEEELQEAQDALEEMVEEEEEEAELEEVEDLLEFYLQRASALQSEAERMLAGARDLEESIGVSLSARRYEVNRLELMLSIGSFAAAIGAMLAGIFGMNMRSCLEHSALSFWGITAAIMAGCAWIFFAVMKYTRSKRIL